MKALKKELEEIRVADAALGPSGEGGQPSFAGKPRSSLATIKEGTIKDWVLKALGNAPNGLETDEVSRAVRELGGPDVPRNSMTPQLSRLKKDGLLTQVGRKWTKTDASLDVSRKLSISDIFGINQQAESVDLLGGIDPDDDDEFFRVDDDLV
jgi:hypothetical protein